MAPLPTDRLSGEVDGLTAPRLRMAMAEAFDRLSGRPLVVDLTEVTLLARPACGSCEMV
jgi:anti-anti-sigma regulatory factor